MLTLLLALMLARSPGSAEVVALAMLHGVPADLAMGIEYAEVGSIPEALRDRYVSPTGDVGRMAVNMRAHCGRLGFHSRAKCKAWLQQRPHATLAGVGLLAAEYRRCAGDYRCAAMGYNRSPERAVYAERVLRFMRALRPRRQS